MADIKRPIIGFLSPEGKFTYCSSYGHSDLATKLCEKLGIDEEGYRGEQCLLEMGYICFRSRDAYMNHYKQDADKLDYSKEAFNFITEKQLAFIKKHENDWNNYEQMKCIEDMVKLSKDLEER